MPYEHLIGGEADGVRHEPGDRVSQSVPDDKVAEWLEVGVIAEVKPPKSNSKKTKAVKATTKSESQEDDDGNTSEGSGKAAEGNAASTQTGEGSAVHE